MTMKWILVTGPRFRVGEDQEEGKAGERRKVCLGHSPVNGIWRRIVRIKHPGLFFGVGTLMHTAQYGVIIMMGMEQ